MGGLIFTQGQLGTLESLIGYPIKRACTPPLTLDDLKKKYRNDDEELPSLWSPKIFGGRFAEIKSETITPKEQAVLDKLSLIDLISFVKIKNISIDIANKYFPQSYVRPNYIDVGVYDYWLGNDGHNDAMRHAYWNALMTKKYGVDFARDFTTAHEGQPGNPQVRETMDLYNNEVGRNIAVNNPDTSEEELAKLVKNSVDRGDMLVVDQHGKLTWSNKVTPGKHGFSGLK